jgi:N-acetylmuramoyl-L-alanine amidase
MLWLDATSRLRVGLIRASSRAEVRFGKAGPVDEEQKFDPKTYHFDLPDSGRPDYVKLKEEWFPDIRAAALRTSKSRGRDPIKAVNTVVIHATAGSSSAGAASVIFNGVASFHWLVPDENEPQHGHFVWATCYESRAAYHVHDPPKINGG